MTTQNEEVKNKAAKKRSKWKYREGFGLLAALIIVGFILEIITHPSRVELPQWPVNLIVIGGYILVTAVIFYSAKRNPFIRWMHSVPSTIAAVSSMTVLVIVMGFVPQEDMSGSVITHLGITHLTRSWPYLLVVLYLITVLTFTIYKRAYPLTWKNAAFLMNHAGLWIVLVAASLGTADLKRLSMSLNEGEKKETAYGQGETKYKVPFAIKLHDFQMEQYNPKIALYDLREGNVFDAKQTNPIRIEPKLNHQIGSWSLQVKKYLSTAVKEGDSYIGSDKRGAAPAALVEVQHTGSRNISKTGWITCGTRWMDSRHLPLSRRFAVVMTRPEAKEFASEVTIYHKNNNTEEDYRLVVNQPYSFGPWKIYQSGYDSRSGRYSRLSVLELVYDPWLEVVYTGIIMMIIGALYLMFFGKRK